MKYVRAKRTICTQCGAPTAGALVLDSGEQIPLCPKCRDTKSVLLSLTGDRSSSLGLVSEYSASKASEVPEGDQIPPMLCRALKDVKPSSMIENIKESENWIACEKYDGVRAVLYIQDGKAHFLGRNRIKSTGSYSDLSKNVPHLTNPVAELEGTVLDGELLFSGNSLPTGAGETTSTLSASVALTNASPEVSIPLQEAHGHLHYYIFDIMRYRGEDLRDLPLSKRLEILDEVFEILKAYPSGRYLHRERCVRGGFEAKEAFYRSIIEHGGEGIVYKGLHTTYCKHPTSRPVSWVKRKKRYTVDAFVTGSIPGRAKYEGQVGALILSVMDGDTPVEVARVSNMPEDFRAEISKNSAVKPQYLGMVLEISFQELTERSGRGRHATIERLRTDKSKEDCRIDQVRLK